MGRKPYQSGQAKKKAFLKAFSACGIIRAAARAARVQRSSHYDWMASDPEYAAAFEDAKEDAADNLEAEALRRAKGKHGSDTLLIFMLKGARPWKYRENVKHEVQGELSFGPIVLQTAPAVSRSASRAVSAPENADAVRQAGGGDPVPGPVHGDRGDDQGGENGRVLDLDTH